MAFSFNNFMTGLASGLSQNKGPIGGFGKGFGGAYNAIQNKINADLEKEAVGKIMSGDNSGWADWGKVNPQAAMVAWNNQQRLNQIQNQREFNTTNERKNAEYLMSQGWTPENAINTAFKVNQNPSQTLSPYEKTAQMEQAKTDIEVARGNEDFEKMKPSVISALDRAETSLKSGTGVGPVSGRLTKFGFSPFKNSASNYANIESANTQMNQILRAKLKATGLTGSELNSAVEANAYRYTISPTDNEAVVMQKIKNFRDDVLGIGTPEETKEKPKKSKYVIEEVIE